MISTFSVVARCAASGMLGVGVASRAIAVGASCVFVRADVGAAASQAVANPYLGPQSLELLRLGLAPAEAIAVVMRNDPGRSVRQLALVDSDGDSAAHTGSELYEWKGHDTGVDIAVAGNLLVSEEPILAMKEAFLVHEGQHLAERLMRALEAGQRAGGDKRGRQSAAIYVVSTEAYADVDLRVDEHEEPLTELRRIWEMRRPQMAYLEKVRCTQANPSGIFNLDERERLRRTILD